MFFYFYSVFTFVQLKPKIYVAQTYAQIRNFSKLRDKTRLSKNFHKHKNGHVVKIWKPLTFTVMVSKRKAK